jgi:hypothetical protein
VNNLSQYDPLLSCVGEYVNREEKETLQLQTTSLYILLFLFA